MTKQEQEVLTDAVDAAFNGAVLIFAEKLRQCCHYSNDFMDAKWHRFVFLEDIEKIAKELLENDKKTMA